MNQYGQLVIETCQDEKGRCRKVGWLDGFEVHWLSKHVEQRDLDK